MIRSRRWLVLLVLTALVASACSGDTAADDRPIVVVTTTILGDVVRQVAGDDARVEVLLPIGADPHDYRPSAREVALLNEADLVIANGLLLEEGLTDVLAAAAADGIRVFEVAPLLDPIPFGHDEDGRDEDGHDDDGLDPHVWLDPTRMADAALLIAAELSTVAPEYDWLARATAYATTLRAVDTQIADLVSGIPADHRKLVTNHDALGYFADRYGFTVVGVVIPGGSTLAEPSSAAMAALVVTMRTAGVRAIFSETIESDTLARAVAAELGADVAVVPLFTGSLGEPGSGAETLVDLLLTNARRIADALT